MGRRVNSISNSEERDLRKVVFNQTSFPGHSAIILIISFFVRYIDDIFMTTNQSVDDIKHKLDTVHNKDVNIKIDYQIDVSVNYLDVTIINEDGRLRTLIYHKSAAEPYILPYTSDHPRHIHRNIPYASLLRAARICSSVEDFDAERVRSDVSLLLNDYPSDFLARQTRRFFQTTQSMAVFEKLDKHTYRRLHQSSLRQSTRREKKLELLTENPINAPAALKETRWDASKMYPRYLHDSANTLKFSSLFHNWWKTYYVYPESPVRNVQARLVTSTNTTLEHLFIQKKPPKKILTHMEEKQDQASS